jgi:hypothetical protein
MNSKSAAIGGIAIISGIVIAGFSLCRIPGGAFVALGLGVLFVVGVLIFGR